jgi:hypothetical protein
MAMSKNGRRTLFYTLLVIFIFGGAAIVLFAEGWRIDLPSLRISKIGGIYVRTYPNDASLSLNGKPVQNQSNFLSSGTLISNLFPKNYRLTITAPGYRTWTENVAVSPSLVANHEYAVMVPATGTVAASGTVENFAVFGNTAIIQTTNNVISFNETPIGSGVFVAASPHLDALVFKNAAGSFLFESLPGGTSVDLSSALLPYGITTSDPRVRFYPLNGAATLILTPTKAAIVTEGAPPSVIVSRAPRDAAFVTASAAPSPAMTAWARSMTGSGSSTIFFYDPSSGTITSSTIATDGSIISLQWIDGNTLGILTDRGDLSVYTTPNETFRHLADDVHAFRATADGSRIAALESSSLEIFTPGNPEGYYRFNIPDIDRTTNAIWYHDDDHLFVVYPDHVAFLDLEDAGVTNFTTIANGTDATYDPSTNALFLIGLDHQLLRFDFPT